MISHNQIKAIDVCDSPGKIRGIILVSIISIIIYSLSIFPILIGSYYVLLFIPFNQLWHFLLLPFLICIGILVTLFYMVLITGLFIHLFNIKYEPGVYEYSYRNKTAFRWILVSVLYTPIRKLFETIPLGQMKNRYFRMLGMNLGDNTLVGGTIMDPCLTEFGKNCTMGLYAVIYGHIQDYEKGILLLDRIKIGNNCVIGAGAFIMPGAVLEDNVKLAAGAVVTKGQILKKGEVYAGIPAREIKSKSRKK
jgi:hypothetical protein